VERDAALCLAEIHAEARDLLRAEDLEAKVGRIDRFATVDGMNLKLKRSRSTAEHGARKYLFETGCPLCYPIFVSFATFVMRKGEISCRA
jgi:hypothetical protein